MDYEVLLSEFCQKVIVPVEYGPPTSSYSPVSPLARLFGLRLYMGVDNSQLHIGGVKCIKDNNQVQLYDQIRGDTDTAHHYHFFG